MKKLFSIILAVFLLLPCGCKKIEKKDITLSSEDMILAAYATPPNGCLDGAEPPFGLEPNYNTKENWDKIHNVGYNYAMPIWYDYTDEHIKATLKNAELNDLKVIIEDRVSPGLPNIIRESINLSYDDVYYKIKQNEIAIKKRYDEFKKYKSFDGVVIMDEPSIEYYNALSAGIDWWRENYPQYKYFSNLFSSYANSNQLFGRQESGTYKEYVKKYVDEVNPNFLCYDFYPLRREGLTGVIHPNWLCDLNLYANISKDNNIPFYIYFQTTQHLNFSKITYYREVAWQCYSAMAYGVKGLFSFMYWSYLIPDNNMNNLGTSLVDAEGNIQPVYYAVQEVFFEINKFQQLYMSFDWQKTMLLGMNGSGTYAAVKDRINKLDGIESIDSSQDALVGQFVDKNGNIAYMVTNYSSPFINQSNDINIKFNNVKKVLLCKKGKNFICNLKNNILQLTMGSGEGYFIIPLN